MLGQTFNIYDDQILQNHGGTGEIVENAGHILGQLKKEHPNTTKSDLARAGGTSLSIVIGWFKKRRAKWENFEPAFRKYDHKNTDDQKRNNETKEAMSDQLD
ncbi:MAG: hypothetical protein GY786_01735 [Proteobacteria bacterium]|nr:hypothetical protein [Pseudomonadota bacterium]